MGRKGDIIICSERGCVHNVMQWPDSRVVGVITTDSSFPTRMNKAPVAYMPFGRRCHQTSLPVAVSVFTWGGTFSRNLLRRLLLLLGMMKASSHPYYSIASSAQARLSGPDLGYVMRAMLCCATQNFLFLGVFPAWKDKKPEHKGITPIFVFLFLFCFSDSGL